MTTVGPDPKTFESWEDAFKYPIPAVRQMEKQLRNDIAGNRERLRTLVGASYRDLLGTAESIVEMDVQMQQVEGYLGDLGKRCNTRLLEKSSANLGVLGSHTRAKDRDRNALASQLAVFRSCPDVISRILRKGGSMLLAAKVLVISRLLHKKLQEKEKAAAYVEGHRARLAKLRRRLLASIDRRFKALTVHTPNLIDAMCAFSLATNSSATDVLRHFHHLRSEGIAAQLETQGEDGKNILRALQLWIKSIQDTQAIFPRLLSSALVGLKNAPLWDNLDTQSTVEINHDVHTEWIGDDIRYFTPYIRHDDLQNDVMRSLLATWTQSTLIQYLNRVRDLLLSVTDPVTVVQLRQKTLELWFSNQGKITGIDKPHVLDSLRQAFMTRLLQLAQSRCRALMKISTEIKGTLRTWEESSNRVANLWDDRIISMQTSKGGRLFIDSIQSSMHGKSSSVTTSLKEYEAWLEGVEVFKNIVQKLRNTQWEEDVDDIDENDDLVDQRHVLLSQDDPLELEDGLKDDLAQVFSKMEGDVENLVQSQEKEGELSKIVFIIRVLRGIKEKKPLNIEQNCFSITSVNKLLEIAAGSITTKLLEKNLPRIVATFKRNTVPEKALWEGDPELPIIPSSWTFKLLRDLVSEMANIGIDIWSPQAVKKVKGFLRDVLQQDLSTELHGGASADKESSEEKRNIDDADESAPPESHLTNGEADETSTMVPPPEISIDRKIQNLFDLMYLDNATLLAPPNHADAFHNVLNARREKLKLELEPGSIQKLEKSAAEYWNRTKLLFGPLI
ncbi:MAG: hypothetical protein MMC33_003497 [Icmadophila ericetorum]|nr:hypothetical protein [Icmadophila ericetorum]